MRSESWSRRFKTKTQQFPPKLWKTRNCRSSWLYNAGRDAWQLSALLPHMASIIRFTGQFSLSVTVFKSGSIKNSHSFAKVFKLPSPRAQNTSSRLRLVTHVKDVAIRAKRVWKSPVLLFFLYLQLQFNFWLFLCFSFVFFYRLTKNDIIITIS